MKGESTALLVRLPADIKAFIAGQSETNGSSQNSEIIRAVRERMDRVSHEKRMTESKTVGKNENGL